MKILFLHNNYPAQFRHLLTALTQSGHEVAFLSVYRSAFALQGVRHGLVRPHAVKPSKNRPLDVYLERLRFAEAFGNAMIALKDGGFTPDIVYSHPGWGCSTYAPDIFPHALHAGYFEWFYTKGADVNFFSQGQGREPSPAEYAVNRQRNMCILDALNACQVGITPTCWQRDQHPVEFQHKLHVLHDGIDTEFFSPDAQESRMVAGLDTSGMEEIVTYATRGLEPYRGFPVFYRSLKKVLEARPRCHAVIMADDRVAYGTPRSDGKTWKQTMCEEVDLDMNRVHFLPFSPYPEYRRLLRLSSVHVYFTVPFVLSWSMLEAMSTGCLVVASNTEPVRELAEHGKTAILTDFFNADELAFRITDALEHQQRYAPLRTNARRKIMEDYDLKKLLPRHWNMLYGAYLQRG